MENERADRSRAGNSQHRRNQHGGFSREVRSAARFPICHRLNSPFLRAGDYACSRVTAVPDAVTMSMLPWPSTS